MGIEPTTFKKTQICVLCTSLMAVLMFVLTFLWKIFLRWTGGGESIWLYWFSAVMSAFCMLIPCIVGIRLYTRLGQTVSRREKQQNLPECMVMIGFGFPVCILINFAVSMISALFPFGKESRVQPFGNDPSVMIMMLFVYAVIPAVCEEIAFRGVLFPMLRSCGERFAWIVSSFLFGMMHSSFSGALVAFLSGLVMTAIYRQSGKLWVTSAIHFLNNAFVLVSVWLADNMNQNSYLRLLLILTAIWIAVALLMYAVMRKKKITLFAFHSTDSNEAMKTNLSVLLSNPLFLLWIVCTIADKIF